MSPEAERDGAAQQARRGCKPRALKVVFRRRGRDRARCVRVGRALSENRAERSLVASSANPRLWRRRTLARRLGRTRLRRIARFDAALLGRAQNAEKGLPALGAQAGAKGSRRLRPRAPRGFRLRGARVSRRLRGGPDGSQAQLTTTRARLGARRRGSRASAAETPGGYKLEVAEKIEGDSCPSKSGAVRGEGLVKITRETFGGWGSSKQVAQVRFALEAQVGPDGKLPKTYRVRYTLTLEGTAQGSDGSGAAEVPFGRIVDPAKVKALFSERVARGDERAYAGLIYAAFNRVKAASENHLKQAEDDFYLRATCNKVESSPKAVLLPSLDVLMASPTNKPNPGAEKKTDWDMTLVPKGNVAVTPGKTKSVKGAPVTGKVRKGGNNRLRGSAGPRSAQIRAGRRALGTVEVEGVSRLGRAVVSVPVAEEVPDQYFRVRFETTDSFGWSQTYESLVAPGTQSECSTTASGSGSRSSSVQPKAGSDQVVVLSGDTLASNDDMEVAGTFAQQGTFTGSRSGPGCSGTFANPTSGCGTEQVDGSAELDGAGRGRATVSLAGPDPFDDAFDDCPLTWPDGRIDGQGELIDDDVDPFLAVSRVQFVLPTDQLNDPTRPTVTATGSRSNSATLFCSASSSNNGGACGPEEDIRIDGDKTYSWKITFTRIPRPF